jgi:hypothetical protein
VCVVRFPVEISARAQEALGCPALTGGAGVPKSLRNLLRVDVGDKQLVQSFEHAEGTGVPNLVDPGTTDHKEASDVPAGVPHCVVERRSDRAVGGFEISAPVDQRGRNVDVVASRG